MSLNTQSDIGNFVGNQEPESINVKLYTYTINIGGEENSLFESNAHTLVYLDSEVQEIDAVIVSYQQDTAIESINRIADDSKQKIVLHSTLDVASKVNVDSMSKGNPVLFTKDIPIDLEKAFKGEQEVFIARTVLPAKYNKLIDNPNFSEELQEKILELEEVENQTALSLVNIQEINSLTNSTIKYTFDKRINNPTKLIIRHDKSFGRQKIFARGLINDKYQPLLLTNTNPDRFVLLKVRPASVNQKMTGYFETFNYNFNFKYETLKPFIGKYADIGVLIHGDSSGNKGYSTSIEQAYKDLWRTFLSILELTKAFSNNFAEYSKLNDKTGKLEIDPTAKIGGVLLGNLNSITDALTAIDGRIELWKQSHPKFVNSTRFAIFKVCILMLTPYIQSSLSLGLGLNQTNKVFQLWYFELGQPIKKGMADDNSQQKPTLDVQAFSSFYNITDTSIILKSQFHDVSQLQSIQNDGYTSLEELPSVLEEENIFTKPGDMNPTGNEISSYYIFVPVKDELAIENLYNNAKRLINITDTDNIDPSDWNNIVKRKELFNPAMCAECLIVPSPFKIPSNWVGSHVGLEFWNKDGDRCYGGNGCVPDNIRKYFVSEDSWTLVLYHDPYNHITIDDFMAKEVKVIMDGNKSWLVEWSDYDYPKLSDIVPKIKAYLSTAVLEEYKRIISNKPDYQYEPENFLGKQELNQFLNQLKYGEFAGLEEVFREAIINKNAPTFNDINSIIFNVEVVSTGQIRGNENLDNLYGRWVFFNVKATFEYPLIELNPKQSSQLLLPSNPNAVFLDKQEFTAMNKYNDPDTDYAELEFDLTKNYNNPTFISQVVLSGLWGNHFDISIVNKEGEIFEMSNFEFTSKLDEKQTVTKLNI